MIHKGILQTCQEPQLDTWWTRWRLKIRSGYQVSSKVFCFEGTSMTFNLNTSSPLVYRKAKSTRYILWATCITIIMEFVWTNSTFWRNHPWQGLIDIPYLFITTLLAFIFPSSNFDTKLHEETNLSLMAYENNYPKSWFCIP
jgi:predicted small integral membrane protein